MKRFEFCYLNHDRRPTFAIFYDDDILSACERMLFRSVAASDLVQTANGTYFIRGWEEGETISVKEVDEELKPPATFSLGDLVPDEPKTPAPAVDLGGLDLSQFAKQ